LANNLYTATQVPAAGAYGRSAELRLEYLAIQAGFEKLKRHRVFFPFADLNVPATQYQPALELGTIVAIYVIGDVNNATANTVITAKINGVSVTMPTLQLLTADTAGTLRSVIPTAANVVTTITDILRIDTDGGGSSVMPGRVIVEMERA
jgi:hypothetical protein